MHRGHRGRWAWGLLLCGLLAAGCHHKMYVVDVPTELEKASLPAYVIEPPDVILIDAVRLVPKPPYRIEPLDALQIVLANPLTEPLAGVYSVEPDGSLNLGATFGTVRVVGMTLEEARKTIIEQVKKVIKEPVLSVSLAQARALQQIRGEHLIRPDGTVGLGTYGSVHVAGLTIADAKKAIEQHLSQYLLNPEVSVDVFSYNSKVYYVITDGGGYGEQVYRFAATGNETVLDAMAQINGVPPQGSKKHIWVARPSCEGEPDAVLPVNWKEITRCGKSSTNYQVLPGDRIYVMAQPIVTVDTFLAKVISPIERLLGVTLLANSVVEGLQPGLSTGQQ